MFLPHLPGPLWPCTGHFVPQFPNLWLSCPAVGAVGLEAWWTPGVTASPLHWTRPRLAPRVTRHQVTRRLPVSSLSLAGRRELVTAPCVARTRDPDRKKRSCTSALRMDPHGQPRRSRPASTLRSFSRSLILCSARTSDDGHSPEEKGPDLFGGTLGQEGDTAGAAESLAGGSDWGRNCRWLFSKVSPGLVSIVEGDT